MLDVKIAQEVLTKTDSAIFVLGDPRFQVQADSDGTKQVEPSLTWTGVEFFWDGRPGDTVKCGSQARRGAFKPFADKFVRWGYSLAGCQVHHEGFAKVWDPEVIKQGGGQPKVGLNKICENSYGNALVFSVAHAVERPGYDRYTSDSKRIVHLSNPIFFLPESKFSEDEVLEFVLRDLCRVDISAHEPEWVTDFVAPGQQEVDREIANLNNRIRKLIEERDCMAEERTNVREPLQLLYETGSALEEAVCSVLEALGAEVERPEDRTKEDGWVTVQVGDKTFDGVLEVEGVRSKHFSLDGLRQITDWRDRGMMLREKTYHGVFVGNSSIEDPPRRRVWPFNKNWVEQAEMRGYAAIRTEDLYILYLLDRTDRLDRDVFWRELFSTKGPFDMSLYRRKLTDEEKDQLENLPQR
jgi:hypothetical protein